MSLCHFNWITKQNLSPRKNRWASGRWPRLGGALILDQVGADATEGGVVVKLDRKRVAGTKENTGTPAKPDVPKVGNHFQVPW